MDHCKSERLSISNTSGKAIFISFLLWLISKKPLHGYDIIKILRSETGFDRIGPGHIYPSLSALSDLGFISSKIVSDGIRQKKSYSITKKGTKHLVFLKKTIFHTGLRKDFFTEMIK